MLLILEAKTKGFQVPLNRVLNRTFSLSPIVMFCHQNRYRFDVIIVLGVC